MYIKQKDRELYNNLDIYLKEPKGFKEFADKIASKNNLIIKESKNSYYCTKCKIIFEEKDIKVNKYCKCPNCNKKFLVKSKRLHNFNFDREFLGIVDRYDKLYIIRNYVLETSYKDKIVSHYYYEYARRIFDENIHEYSTIINNHVVGTTGGTFLVPYESIQKEKWRYSTGYYNPICDNLIYYPGNIKKIFKNTRWQYTRYDILSKHKEYYNIAYLMQYDQTTIELLIKLKLYNLALCPRTYSKKGNFEQRFGVEKSYLKYMQKINIDEDELEILAYSKIKNKKILDKFSRYNISDLKKYNIDLNKLNKYTNINQSNSYEYFDYLRFAKELKYDLTDKSILYPKNIKQSHDRLQNIIEVNKNKKFQVSIKKKYKKLLSNIYQDKKYIIKPANSIESMIDESSQQHNCVKTYVDRVANNECDIYFMRLVDSQDKSLVTVEVRDNKVYQQRIKNNKDTTKEQKLFLKNWEREILKNS